MNLNNIVITGLPRSGTTLVCHLLNKVDNAVALHEPIKIKSFNDLSEAQIFNHIIDFFDSTRSRITQHKQAISLLVNDEVPDNHMSCSRDSRTGLRQKSAGAEKGLFEIKKDLDENFKLYIKHNAIFSHLLTRLQKRFSCYAVIRNPLSLLASWNSVQLPINRGHIPAAERINPELATLLTQTDGVIDRQIIIMSWFFEQFSSLPDDQVIRYEDVVTSGGKVLKQLLPSAKVLNESLQNKNLNDLYDHQLMLKHGKKLLASEGIMWDYYHKSDVEKLMSEIYHK